jgi:hypothetical protein
MMKKMNNLVGILLSVLFVMLAFAQGAAAYADTQQTSRYEFFDTEQSEESCESEEDAKKEEPKLFDKADISFFSLARLLHFFVNICLAKPIERRLFKPPIV